MRKLPTWVSFSLLLAVVAAATWSCGPSAPASDPTAAAGSSSAPAKAAPAPIEGGW